jgi:hypothetical protein
MKATEAALNADDYRRGNTRDTEVRLHRLTAAHRTRRNSGHRVGGWIQRLDGTLIETCAGQGRTPSDEAMKRAAPGGKGQVERAIGIPHQ